MSDANPGIAEDTIQVYSVERDEVITVSRQEAAAGMMRYARSLGRGTPACGQYEQRALKVLRGENP